MSGTAAKVWLIAQEFAERSGDESQTNIENPRAYLPSSDIALTTGLRQAMDQVGRGGLVRAGLSHVGRILFGSCYDTLPMEAREWQSYPTAEIPNEYAPVIRNHNTLKNPSPSDARRQAGREHPAIAWASGTGNYIPSLMLIIDR